MAGVEIKVMPKRKRTNLSVRVDLLQIAREDNLNLSGMLESKRFDSTRRTPAP